MGGICLKSRLLLPLAFVGVLMVSSFGANRSSPREEPGRLDFLENEFALDGAFMSPEEGRARCVMNIRNVQQGMRSFQNMNGFEAGGPGLEKRKIVGPRMFVEEEPICPSGGRYRYARGKFPKVGTLYLRCSHPSHVPKQHHDW